jgi:hypothetical protein
MLGSGVGLAYAFSHLPLDEYAGVVPPSFPQGVSVSASADQSEVTITMQDASLDTAQQVVDLVNERCGGSLLEVIPTVVPVTRNQETCLFLAADQIPPTPLSR